MDELVLENICDRVKSLLIPKGETVSPCCVTHLPRSSSLLCARMMILQLRTGHKRRRSSPKDAVRGEGSSPEQPSSARRREELLHAGTGELQRRRAPVVVPDPPVRGAVAAVVVDARGSGIDRGVRAGRGRPQVRDGALPLHFRQREGEEERSVLLAGVADMGGGGDPAGVVEAQTSADGDVLVARAATLASSSLLVDGREQAETVHGAANITQA